jgi:hypothetical protein
MSSMCFNIILQSIQVFQLKFSMQFTYRYGYVDSVLDVDLRSWGIVMALPFAVAHKLAALWQHLTLSDVWVRQHPQSHVQPPQEPNVEKESQLGDALQTESVVLMVSLQSMKLTFYLIVLTLKTAFIYTSTPKSS